MKKEKYQVGLRTIRSLTENEFDLVSVMSTISCELYHAFEPFIWVGFYRLVDKTTLKVGPYQGTHGCLTINLDKGVCGKCVRENAIQIENDVSAIPHHIACSSETKSEIVLPVRDLKSRVRAVLDVDSNTINCFDAIDKEYLTEICALVSPHY
ncbi:MAG: GAF domain-containing protein [Opitutae bacterium]|nr:GAF domain-containing protein [Opitutae bacterium]